jgi:hypothetical protein
MLGASGAIKDDHLKLIDAWRTEEDEEKKKSLYDKRKEFAEKFKDQGNELFKKNHYNEAVEWVCFSGCHGFLRTCMRSCLQAQGLKGRKHR